MNGNALNVESEDKNMKFSKAFELMKHGEKVKLPSWGGYWYWDGSRKTIIIHTKDGELRGSIYTAIETSSEKIVGICYTNKKYAQYVEFGTGPKGQKQHAGISPDVAYAYVQSPWWIHESMIGRKTAEKYKWFYVDTPDGRFYQCTGQAAQPFLYPALKNNELEIAHYFEEAIEKNL